MKDRKDAKFRVIILAIIMTFISMATGGAAIFALYRVSFEQQRERLDETARSQARIIEAIARFNSALCAKDVPGGAAATTLREMADAHEHLQGFGETGEFIMAKRESNQIVFLLSHWHPSKLKTPQPVPFSSELAEPMRQALSGRSGTMVGADYSGTPVLAAYVPVAKLDMGIVAKIDLAEIRAPFIKAGLLSGAGGFVFILLGSILFVAIGNPMAREIEESEKKYRSMFESAADMLVLSGFDGTIFDVNPAACSAFGYSRKEFLECSVKEIVYPDARVLYDRSIELLAEGENFSTETMSLRKDGTEFPVEIRLAPALHEGRPAILAALRDITDRKQIEEALEERLRFETLLSGISSRFVNVPTSDVGAEVNCALQQVGEFLGVERCTFLEFLGPEKRLRATHSWVVEGLEMNIPLSSIKVDETLPFFTANVLSGKPYIMLQTDDVPDEAAAEKEFALTEGIKSHVTVPLSLGGSIVGALSLGSFHAQKVWPEEIVLQLRIVGEVFIHALARSRAEEALRESESRYRTLFQYSPISLWETDHSELAAYIDQLRKSGVRDIREHFEKNPDELAKTVRLMRIIDVNQAALDLYEAESKKQLDEGLGAIIDEEGYGPLLGFVAAVAQGQEKFELDNVNNTLTGKRKHISLKGFVAPGHEETWSKVTVAIVDTTREKEIEEALRESLEKWRSLVENAPDIILTVDREGKTMFINHPPAGMATEDAIGTNAIDYVAPDHRDIVRQSIGRVFETGEPDSYEVVARGPYDTLSWYSTRLAPIKNNGEVVAVLLITRDITDSKRTEEALRESETRFSSFMKHLPGVAFIKDSESRHLFVNEAFTKLLDMPREEIINKTNRELFPPEMAELLGLSDTEVLSLGKPIAVRQSILLGDKKRHFWTVKFPIPIGRTGESTLLGGVAVDITERELALEAMRESEARYRALFEHSPISLWEMDFSEAKTYIDGLRDSGVGNIRQHFVDNPGDAATCLSLMKLVDMNATTLEMYEYDSKADLQNNLDDILREESYGAFLELVVAIAEGDVRFELENINRTATGKQKHVFVKFHVVPGHAEKLSQVLVSIVDITDRKEAEEKVKASLREKEVLLKEIHHRVKNNLQVISSLLYLQSNRAGDKHSSLVLRESRDRVKSMALVHERLYRSEDLARVDFEEYVRELVLHLLQSQQIRPDDIALDLNLKGFLFDINRAVPLGLIVNELISNCLKHAFPAGKDLGEGKGELSVSLQERDENRLTLVVRDNGVGLPEDFDFENTESMGLFLVRALVEQLDGVVELDRSNGTAFKISLPIERS